jgi:hypothetical protein
VALLIKNPRSKLRGIEDFSLKYLRMWGNKSPAPPVFRPKGRGIKPKGLRPIKDKKSHLPQVTKRLIHDTFFVGVKVPELTGRG